MNHNPEELQFIQYPTLFLTSLSENDQQHLSSRVARWQGVCRIFVHPFYAQNQSIEYPIPNAADKPQQLLRNLVAKSEDSTPPIILMEESMQVNRTIKRLDVRLQTLYVVPTETSSPQPITNDDGSYSATGFSDLSRLLLKLNVSKVVLAGMFLSTPVDEFAIPSRMYLSQRRNKGAITDTLVSGCVGDTARYLTENGLSVTFSHFCYPENLTSIGNLERRKFVRGSKFR